jgi:hypothetical protein
VVTFGQVKDKKEFALLEPNEYVLVLDDIEESEGNYGDRLIWKFLVAEKDAPTDYIARDDGQPKSLWAFTDQDIIVGALNHEFIEKLTGRTFSQGSEPPDADELLGKRVLGYVGHEIPKSGKNAGVKREKIFAGSIKPFKLPGQKAASKPAPTQVSADPSDEDVDRALLVSDLQSQVSKLGRLNKDAGRAAQDTVNASDLGNAPLADIERLVGEIKAAVAAELDS